MLKVGTEALVSETFDLGLGDETVMGPRFDEKNMITSMTTIRGKPAELSCKVLDLDNKTVS